MEPALGALGAQRMLSSEGQSRLRCWRMCAVAIAMEGLTSAVTAFMPPPLQAA